MHSSFSSDSLVRHSHCRSHSTHQNGSLASLSTLCGTLSRKTKGCTSKYVKANFLICLFSFLWSRSFIFYFSVSFMKTGPGWAFGHWPYWPVPASQTLPCWVLGVLFPESFPPCGCHCSRRDVFSCSTLSHQPFQTSPICLHLEVGTCLSSFLELVVWCGVFYFWVN